VAEGSERNTELPQFSEFAPVAVGTAVWALLFVIGLAIRPDLEDGGRGWWVWTAAAGVVLGGVGFLVLRRRQIKLRQQARAGSTQAGSTQAGSTQAGSTQAGAGSENT
jgi:Protein of unknown function (DUF2530)